MVKYFIKNGEIKAFDVQNGKVITTVIIGNRQVSNPLLEDFLSLGWEIYEDSESDSDEGQYTPSYSDLVEDYIRTHGYPTYGAELAVINNYAVSPTLHEEDYNTYMQVREDAKEYARQIIENE